MLAQKQNGLKDSSFFLTFSPIFNSNIDFFFHFFFWTIKSFEAKKIKTSDWTNVPSKHNPILSMQISFQQCKNLVLVTMEFYHNGIFSTNDRCGTNHFVQFLNFGCWSGYQWRASVCNCLTAALTKQCFAIWCNS